MSIDYESLKKKYFHLFNGNEEYFNFIMTDVLFAFYEIEKILKSHKINRVLEVGCGTGRFTKHFSSKFDNLIASDASPDMLELAKKNCVGLKNVSFQLIQVDNISAADNTYDIVYGIRLLNQLADKTPHKKR